MRKYAALAGALLFTVIYPGGASAHFLPHKRHLTPAQRVGYFERSVGHDRAELCRTARQLAGVHEPAELAAIQHERRWHRAALRWHLDLLRRARAAVPAWTGDFETATRIVGRHYGDGVRGWLLDCSSSEGGHGGWVWFAHGGPPAPGEDKPGGWMQFFSGTFYSNVGWAFADARSRGLRLAARARSYFSALGQAVVAGAMYAAHGNPGTWTGARC